MAENHDQSQGFKFKKNVDESWKDTVEKEKKDPASETSEESHAPEPSFPFFISTLGMQALSALGEIPDPATKLKRVDFPHAQYVIDTLHMLSEKTHGNLSKEEEAMMQNLLYELQMKFVEKSKTP